MTRTIAIVSVLAALLAPAPAVAQSASPQTLDAEALIRGLSRSTEPRPGVRSLRPPPATAPAMGEGHRTFLRSLTASRSLVEEERTELASIVTAYELPQIDVQIHFDFNSDGLRSEAFPDLLQIARALQDPALVAHRFVVAGHTDGVGSAAYNLDLSRRRAEAVRGFLIATGIDPERLISAGFGFDRLKNAVDPSADENRRVELINLEVGWQ